MHPEGVEPTAFGSEARVVQSKGVVIAIFKGSFATFLPFHERYPFDNFTVNSLP